ncbi:MULTISPECIES: hypothetical protein [unclassified Coleofasciculus]|nr:hypothetical protein [Coleofasciculus sp. FACHB-SPT9]MBD1889693.1 hypothetical protein [Coleofasciculus sp. FACHB-SPT9]
MKRSSKVLAGLIGAYAGDALGFPVKFITKSIGEVTCNRDDRFWNL